MEKLKFLINSFLIQYTKIRIIIHDILKKLAHEGKWFSENKHGFRPGKSTESASCTLINLIENNKNKKMATCCAFLDIKSAFDAA